MNVILIVADGLQAAALGAYGNDWLPTPHLDRLASESVVFDSHFADAPLAGFPLVVANFRLIELPSLLPPWEETEFLVAAFEDWEFDTEPDEDVLNPQPGFLDPNDDRALDQLRRVYGIEVQLFDTRLAEEIDRLQDSGELDDALLIVTSTRGQNLGEHGLIGDLRPWLHEEMVHLPLFVRLPGNEQAGRRVSHLTQTSDIPATVYDALGTATPVGGNSLLPLCRGGGAMRPHVCMKLQIGEAVELALQTPEEKVILPIDDPTRGPMYFVKPDDRWEVNNLRQQHLDRAEELEQTLRKIYNPNPVWRQVGGAGVSPPAPPTCR